MPARPAIVVTPEARRTAAAERQRRRRARRRDGQRVLRIELNFVDFTEAAIEVGLIDWSQAEDIPAAEAAAEQILENWISRVTRDGVDSEDMPEVDE